jgi:hypothetical protein
MARTTPEEKKITDARNEVRRWSMRASMTPITFETFDPSFYQRMGRIDALEALALGRALVEQRPRDASPQVDRIAGKLDGLVSEGEAMLTIRRRESIPLDHSFEVLLDALADSLWSTLRTRLDGWSVYEHRAMASVQHAYGKRSAVAVALARARSQAARAREVSGHLFGAQGLAFIRLPYPAQARSMASLLRLIHEDGLAPAIDELAGREMMVALTACQAQYEAMVRTRMSRTDRRSGHFGVLIAKLRRLLARYVNAVLTLLDEDEPESLELVLAVLRPIEVHRAQLGREASRAGASVVEPKEDDEANEASTEA